MSCEHKIWLAICANCHQEFRYHGKLKPSHPCLHPDNLTIVCATKRCGKVPEGVTVDTYNSPSLYQPEHFLWRGKSTRSKRKATKQKPIRLRRASDYGKELGSRIRAARKAKNSNTIKGCKVSDFSQRMLVSESTILQWESGRSIPSRIDLKKIAKYLGVKMTWLQEALDVPLKD